MAFDLKRLAEESVDLETPLRASLDEVTGGLTLAPMVAVWDGSAAIPINPPSLVDKNEAAGAARRARAQAGADTRRAAEVAADIDAALLCDNPREAVRLAAVDHMAELEAVIELCQTAAARAAGLLARLRGGAQ